MSGQRKLWTTEEDKVLRQLREKGIKKWSVIAKIMETQYNIMGRTGKQCRQRWFNRLDPKINSQDWSQEDNRRLFQLHDELGNSWVKISKEFEGRTDNSIKNHFYSILRKSIRRVNKYISTLDANEFDLKLLDSALVSKIVSGADDKFDKKLFLPTYIIQRAHELKNRLVPFCQYDKNEWNDKSHVIKVYQDLVQFQKDYNEIKSVSPNPKTIQNLFNHKQNQIKQQINQQSPQIEQIIVTIAEKKVPINKMDFLKRSSSLGQQIVDISKRSSNSLLLARSSYNKSEEGSCELLLKKISSASGFSCLFPPVSSYDWEKEAMMISVNNIHGQNGQMPQKSQFLFQRLDGK